MSKDFFVTAAAIAMLAIFYSYAIIALIKIFSKFVELLTAISNFINQISRRRRYFISLAIGVMGLLISLIAFFK